MERGYVGGSTTWNKDWAKVYGPEAYRAVKNRDKIAEAIEALQKAGYVPPVLQQAKQIVHSRSLASQLKKYQPNTKAILVYIIQAWLVFLAWKKQDEEAIAVALLAID